MTTSRVDPMDEVEPLDLIGWLIRTMTDDNLVEADGPWLYEVARGLAHRLHVDFAVVDRELLNPENDDLPLYDAEAAARHCYRFAHMIGHGTHGRCPGSAGPPMLDRQVPADQLRAAAEQPLATP